MFVGPGFREFVFQNDSLFCYLLIIISSYSFADCSKTGLLSKYIDSINFVNTKGEEISISE